MHAEQHLNIASSLDLSSRICLVLRSTPSPGTLAAHPDQRAAELSVSMQYQGYR